MTSPRKKGRVLLVEDNPVNQKITGLMLRKLGYEFDIANNGREAVALAGEKRHEIMLLDCEMPELDGYGAARAIREAEKGGPRVPMIAFTANALAGTREQCLAAGMDLFLTKPVQLQDLRLALDAARKLIPPPGQ